MDNKEKHTSNNVNKSYMKKKKKTPFSAYNFFYTDLTLWIHSELEDLHITSTTTSQDLQLKLLKRNNVWSYYNLISEAIFSRWSWGKIPADSNTTFPIAFAPEVQRLSNAFQMPWAEFMLSLPKIFPHHKWSPIFDILSRFHKKHSEWLSAITTKSNITKETTYSKQGENIKRDKHQSNTDSKSLLKPSSNLANLFDYDAFIDRVYFLQFKENLNETYYQRTNTWHTRAQNKTVDINTYINQSIKQLKNHSKEANISAVTLWLNCQELQNRKIIMKTILDGFFLLLKKEFKDSKIFYIRQISYDKIMGMQLDIVFISNHVLHINYPPEANKPISCDNQISQLWRNFCLQQPQSNITVITKSRGFEARGNDYFLTSKSKILSFINLSIYCGLVYGRTRFMDIDLPMIRSFSKGKIHAN